MIMAEQLSPSCRPAEHPLPELRNRSAGRPRSQQIIDTNRIEQRAGNRTSERLRDPRHHPNTGAAAALGLLLPRETHTPSISAGAPDANSITPDATTLVPTRQENETRAASS